jgi:CRISPR/Cas system-associated endonuclease Cas1
MVDKVWVLTGGAAISSRLVRALSRGLIDVVFFDGRGEPAARLFPPEANGAVSRRRAQYEAYLNVVSTLLEILPLMLGGFLGFQVFRVFP